MKTRKFDIPSGRWSKENTSALYQALKHHLSLEPIKAIVSSGSRKVHPGHLMIPPGYQQVSFNELIREEDLWEDGANRRHAPGDEWKFRVWAGGLMKFDPTFVYSDALNFVHAREKITDVRLVGDLATEDAKVMVTLTKYYDLANPRPTRKDDETSWQPGKDVLDLVKEEKYLFFMREVPPNLKTLVNHRQPLPPPTAPFHAQTMTPTPTLLFRFSALTRNDHKIHLDTEFTKSFYEIPKLLVHGPLTAVLMLEVLRKGLALYAENLPHLLAVREFEYKNLLPLFVGEEITIACKKVQDVRPREDASSTQSDVPWERWDVWIQKGGAEGERAILAVRGKALVSPYKRPAQATSRGRKP